MSTSTRNKRIAAYGDRAERMYGNVHCRPNHVAFNVAKDGHSIVMQQTRRRLSSNVETTCLALGAF